MSQSSMGRPPTVLIADDDAAIRLIAQAALKSHGLNVVMAADGKEALRLFERTTPDIVLLDLEMPFDGFRTCRAIRDLPGGKRTPILMLTGSEDLESIAKAYEFGATDFVTKPVNWLILRERIRYMLRSQQAYSALVRSEAQNKALLNAIPDLMCQIDSCGILRDLRPSREFEEIIDVPSVIGTRMKKLVPEHVLAEGKQVLEEALSSGKPQRFEYTQRLLGQARDFEARMVVSGEDRVLVILRDITARTRAVQELKRERDFVDTVLQTAAALVVVLDRKGRIVRFNRACESVSGYTFEEIRGKFLWSLCPPQQAEGVQSLFEVLVNGGEARQDFEAGWLTREGEIKPIVWSESVLHTEDGDIEYIVAVGLDISDRKKAEEEIRQLAYYDPLTGLPNRALFGEKLDEALATGRPGAVMFLDLDHFKRINDTLGHTLGDQLLQNVASRLRASIRATESSRDGDSVRDTISRFGGDEFTILLANLNTTSSVSLVAERIKNSFKSPFLLAGQEVFVSASIGISLYPQDGKTADELLKNADTAMYNVKEAVRDNYSFYQISMNAGSLDRLAMENDLRKALRADEFILHYQPKLDALTTEIVGVEALIRWCHPTRGLVPPGSFISLAEETGMIVPIGEWVLRRACLQVKKWKSAGIKTVPIAVNLSCLQFQQPNLVETIAEILEETGTRPAELELEITESVILRNAEEASRTIRRLKEIGIAIAVDDFGAGFSSLGRLKRFTVDSLKIDRSFMTDLGANEDDQAIIRAILAIGHTLGLKVVAEGVETWAQFQFLLEQECDQIQGFLFSPPLTADAIAPLLEVRKLKPRVSPSGDFPPDSDPARSGMTTGMIHSNGRHRSQPGRAPESARTIPDNAPGGPSERTGAGFRGIHPDRRSAGWSDPDGAMPGRAAQN